MMEATTGVDDTSCVDDTFCTTCPPESTPYYLPDTSNPKNQTPLAHKGRYGDGRGEVFRVRQGWGSPPPLGEKEPTETTGYEGDSTADLGDSRVEEVEDEDTEVDDAAKGEGEGHNSSYHSSSLPSDDSYLPSPQETSMTLEPFQVFCKKVKDFMRRVGNAYTADHVEDFGISSHRIIAIHHNKRPGSSKSLPSQILRIPCNTKLWTDGCGRNANIHHHMAVKAHIRRLNLTVGPPVGLAYDTTSGNELGCSYILEVFCKGGVLRDQEWCRDMETKLDICEQVINILSEQERIRFPESGKLVSAWKLPERHSDYISGMQNPTELPTSVKIDGLGIGVRTAPQKTLRGIIKEFIRAWPLREKIWFLTAFDHMWEKLRVVADEMYRLQFFDDEDGYDAGLEETCSLPWRSASKEPGGCQSRAHG